MRKLCLALLLASAAAAAPPGDFRLVILDPGHFHASLIQKDSYPDISPRVAVYAPLGPGLLDYMSRVALFNDRAESPTRWELDVHTGPDFLARMLRERPGNVAVFAGRNRAKIGRILQCLEAGYHIFADKPWIIVPEDLPKLASALDTAERKNLAAYDIMTERYEITSILQKEIVNAPEVFGTLEPGTPSEPGVKARSVHQIMKLVAGVPLRRPAWFFDVEDQGEGLSDVGTHVVDLVQWTVFPTRALDYHRDVRMLGARHWPIQIDEAQFRQVTGEGFPRELAGVVKNSKLDYYCNNMVRYAVAGVHVELEILWNWEAREGGDIYEATFRGTRANTQIRQGAPEKFRPELYIVPSPGADAEVMAALRKKIDSWQSTFPGVGMEMRGNAAHITVPEKLRVSHEAHFAQVANRYLTYLRNPKSMPAWEKSNMLVKYYISTKGVDMSRSR